ncbi:amidohydrolase family protein [Galbitalea sp. SE-J8]|uniref:amidohydrolase n=1 Tax=Galbitalea sp. SE-J8 TaxID=3054952 RepID=UPI00259CE42F|nr:amidohydrolase family protein [Galbitalea sp. SE-J8]MDM4763890.1 amidohydrolase family protein [Galbitalea sp. SE-J8]
MTDVLLAGGRRYGGAPVDILVRHGRIAAVGTGLRADAVERVVLDGRYLGPGLWDEHVHLAQHAVARGRLGLSGARSAAEVLDLVATHLASRESTDPLVGYGFRDALWPDAPTRNALDAVTGDVPVTLISGDLHCGWLNGAAARRAGVETDASGVLREGPWIAVLSASDEVASLPRRAIADAVRAAAERGVVGIVDLENADNVADWTTRSADGIRSVRVEASVWPDRLDAVIARGIRSRDVLDDAGLVTMGPLKIVVDGSLNTRTAWTWDPYPDSAPTDAHACGVDSVAPAELRRLLALARDHGLDAAVHAIGDRANSEVLDAFEALGVPGRIEHAQLVARRDLPRFAALGVVASVQPEHAMDDRDAADRHWRGRSDRAFAYGSLWRAGASLRLGSDAPVAPLDPWITADAAVSRSRDGREPWHPDERIPVEVALAASARGSLHVGEAADLVVVERDPFADGDLRRMPVAATLLAGRFTHCAL